MAEWMVNPGILRGAGVQGIDNCARSLRQIREAVRGQSASLRLSGYGAYALKRNLQNICGEIDREAASFGRLSSALENAALKYRDTENRLAGVKNLNISSESAAIMTGTIPTDGAVNTGPGFVSRFAKEMKSNYGWKEVLSGAGYIGTAYNLVSGFKGAKSAGDYIKTGKKAYNFVKQSVKTFNNYKQIGHAVGTKTAAKWYVKNITGLKPLGRASAAKNPITRFKNNLTNKTSPFNAQIKDIANNFTGKNGVGKAVGSWASVAVTGVTNLIGNLEEQKNSNGTMSTGRVVAETVTETVVDTAFTYGASIVVGAAITTALGTVAAPGVLVAAATGLVVAGVNSGIKALTGKTATEWVSDTILDAGEAIGKAVGNAAQKATKAVGKWFGKLFS